MADVTSSKTCQDNTIANKEYTNKLYYSLQLIDKITVALANIQKKGQ